MTWADHWVCVFSGSFHNSYSFPVLWSFSPLPFCTYLLFHPLTHSQDFCPLFSPAVASIPSSIAQTFFCKITTACGSSPGVVHEAIGPTLPAAPTSSAQPPRVLGWHLLSCTTEHSEHPAGPFWALPNCSSSLVCNLDKLERFFFFPKKYSPSLAIFQLSVLESKAVSQGKNRQSYCKKGKITYFTLSSFQKWLNGFTRFNSNQKGK